MIQTAKEIGIVERVNRWPHVRLDQFRDIDMMTTDTLDLLNEMCQDAMFQEEWTHRINSDYRQGDAGQHGRGRAVDLVFFRTRPGDLDVWEQYKFALKYPWGAVGAYPFWGAPGIHVDSRKRVNDRLATWWRDAQNIYRGIGEVEKVFGVMV